MLKATGRMEYDPVNGIVRFVGRESFAGLKDQTLDVPFQMLEVAYLTSRNIELQKLGVRVQLGTPSAPNDGTASVSHVGSPVLATERN